MRKIRWIRKIALTLGILFGFGWWVIKNIPHNQVAYLPDGSTLTLEAWNYGKMHALKRRNTVGWKFFLPQVVAAEETNSDTLALWLHRSRAAPGQKQANLVGVPVSTWWDWAELSDDHGHVIRTVNNDSPHEHIMTATSPLSIRFFPAIGDECFLLNAFPRRGTVVTARFFVTSQSRPIAEFTVPNPTPGNYPDWTPQPLPITQQQGDLKVALVSLAPNPDYIQLMHPNSFASQSMKNLKSPLLPGELVWSEATFRVFDHDKPDSNWESAGLPSFQDATGNVYASSSCFGSRAKSIGIGFQLPNFPSEPCKLIVGLRKTLNATFPPEDVHTFKAVKVAPANTFVPSGESFQYQNHTITLLGMGGTGTVTYPIPSEWKGSMYSGKVISDAPGVRFKVVPADPDLRLILKAQDAQGRTIEGFPPFGFGSHAWLNDQGEEYTDQGVVISFNRKSRQTTAWVYNDVRVQMPTFFLNIPPSTQTLNLTIAVNEKRTFEFLLPAP